MAEFDIDNEPGVQADESAEILEQMPAPQQHAIDAAAVSTPTQESGSVGASDTDSDGAVWDASVHATGSDGKGIKTAKGLWRKKRGKAGHTSTVSRGKSLPIYAPGQSPVEIAVAQARAAGTAAAMSVFAMGRALGGEEWQPTPEEVTVMSEAYANYFIAKGITDFPPVLAVCITTAAYAGPRFFAPKTQERVGTIKHWFAVRVAKWRVKKALKARGIESVVTIKGTKSADVYNDIMVNGRPFNETGIKVETKK